PRLFLTAAQEKTLQQRLATEPVLKTMRDQLIAEAQRTLKTKPVERTLIGRRLLEKSRTCLSRVAHLAMAWRLTGDAHYLERARAELLAVVAFTDWNPKHFLDVAEMTAAVAIGYDWFYPALDAETRQTLRTALVEKGLKPGLVSNSWSRGTNNWNQVCNAGLTLGALAVYEDEPALAGKIVAQAVRTVPLSMAEFAPDGAYPEGPGYWGYGTSFNVLLIAALESTLGTDFGLAAQPGFLATADYFLHVAGPTGLYFNYSDCGTRSGMAPAMAWFAARRHAPYLLWTEFAKLQENSNGGGRGPDRLFPLMLLWQPALPANPPTPPALSWTGRGHTPVALHRSSWEPTATFIALKGGTPAASHAHMDIGGFVMDADGVRWAEDLGMQDYTSLEAKGIDLWGRKQNSARWKVFRLGQLSHNILVVDGQQQLLAGKAEIVTARAGRTVIDSTTVYAGQLAQARRGAELRADRTVVLQDEIAAPGDKTVIVRWGMVTSAEVKLAADGQALLTKAGKQLTFRVLAPAGAELKIYPTDPPPADTDARNPGTRMLGFEVKVPAGASQRIAVQLVPGSASASPAELRALSEW
ncbi:MAG: heparinase II/III family protein, partial [Opitutae bacterium]|nr:heparinase II/III family protein [Opitutae bacterium]